MNIQSNINQIISQFAHLNLGKKVMDVQEKQVYISKQQEESQANMLAAMEHQESIQADIMTAINKLEKGENLTNQELKAVRDFSEGMYKEGHREYFMDKMKDRAKLRNPNPGSPRPGAFSETPTNGNEMAAAAGLNRLVNNKNLEQTKNTIMKKPQVIGVDIKPITPKKIGGDNK